MFFVFLLTFYISIPPFPRGVRFVRCAGSCQAPCQGGAPGGERSVQGAGRAFGPNRGGFHSVWKKLAGMVAARP